MIIFIIKAVFLSRFVLYYLHQHKRFQTNHIHVFINSLSNMDAQLHNGTTCLNIDLSLYHHFLYFVYVSREGSGETVHMPGLPEPSLLADMVVPKSCVLILAFKFLDIFLSMECLLEKYFSSLYQYYLQL